MGDPGGIHLASFDVVAVRERISENERKKEREIEREGRKVRKRWR